MTMLRIPFPYDIGGIYRRLIATSDRHSRLCREELIELRAELARRDEKIESLQQQLSHERRNNHHK